VKTILGSLSIRQTESGQALLEFVLMLTLTLGFVFFFLQLSFLFAWGSFVQYSTYMSARSYLAAGRDQDEQRERAASVIRRMLKQGIVSSSDRFPGFARGVGGGELTGVQIGPGSLNAGGDSTQSWMDGVRYTFRSSLFLLPLGGARVNGVTLTSEAWLGREPSYEECTRELDGSFFDNGC
jgi:hypothetical protein